LLTAEAVAEVFETFVFGFMTTDIRREIQLAHRTVAGAIEPDLVPGGGNVLAAIGLLTFTEFLGWVMKRTRAENQHWDDEQTFNEGFRLLGPQYEAILDQKLVKPYHEFRSSLVHSYAVEKTFCVDMPGDAPCGIVKESDGWHFVVERYFADFSAASDQLYSALTARSAVEARARFDNAGVNRDLWYVSSFERLGDLVVDVPPLRDLLDLAIGAAASFMRAEQFGYKDRSFALPDNYYEYLGARARWMANGKLPSHGLWISGYYFNSGLIRLSEARKQLRSLLKKLAKRPGVPQLASDKHLRDEADRLKHEPKGLRERREVTFQTAVSLLEDLVAIIDNEKSALRQLSVGAPRTSSERRNQALKPKAPPHG